VRILQVGCRQAAGIFLGLVVFSSICSAQSTAFSGPPFSPFQFLQKPGPYPVGLNVVNTILHESFLPHLTVPTHLHGKEAVLCRRSSGIQQCQAGLRR